MIRLLIADDHKILLDSFVSLFRDQKDIVVVAIANNGVQVMELLNGTEVDVALLDINMPEMNGVETAKKISKEFPSVKVIALSMYKEASYVKRMKAHGAKGYLLKDDSADEMIKAIHLVDQGQEYYSNQLKDLLLSHILTSEKTSIAALTRREKEVLGLIADGNSNKAIASKLFVSIHTVDSHRKNLLAKFDAKNTAELVKKAMEKGLI